VQQFIYDSPGNVYIQYWLLNQKQPCPSNSWSYYDGIHPPGGTPGCFINGNQTTPKTAQAITDLAKLRLTGSSSSGWQFAILEAADGTLWGSPDVGDPLGIGTLWNAAEFNVFGAGGGSTANLTPKPGTTIVVRTSVNNGTTNAPSWGGGITAESNNLTLAPPPCPIAGASPALVFTESNTAGVTSMCECPAGSVWLPNSAACGPPAGMCTASGCASSWEWQYSLTCTGMGVGIVYNGGCPGPGAELGNCYAGFDKSSSTVSASWGGVSGPPTYSTAGGQGSPTVCTEGLGQDNCNVFTISGLPACPNIPPSPPPLCPDGEKYCTKFSPPMCVPARLCLVQPTHP
jgi:hypothetical protein